MKAYPNTRIARLAGLTIVLALLAGVAGLANAQEKGGARLLRSSGAPIVTKATTAEPKKKSCGGCKDSFVTRRDLTARGAHAQAVRAAQHGCSSCGNQWALSGHGKAKVATPVHKCSNCL